MDKNQYEDGRLTAAALINFEGRGRTTPRFLESGLTKIDLIHNFKITVNLAGLIKNFKKQACMAQQDWAYGFPDQTTPPIAETLCIKNPRAIVVCGFLMK